MRERLEFSAQRLPFQIRTLDQKLQTLNNYDLT